VKFKEMEVGEIFAAWGNKFVSVAVDKNDLYFEKVDATHAREVIDFHGEQRPGEVLVLMDPDEKHPATWEP
jgi:hypothetical protein